MLSRDTNARRTSAVKFRGEYAIMLRLNAETLLTSQFKKLQQVPSH